MELFTNSTFRSLEQGLSASSMRNKAIAENIANVNTPHYKSKEIIFKNELETAKRLEAKKTSERHINFSNSSYDQGYAIRTKTNTTMRNNGNNVDIDREMSLLAENQIYYNALIERLNGKFSTLKSIARGGK